MPYRLKVAYTTAQHRQWSHKSGFLGVCEFNPLSMAFVLLERGGLGPMACLLRQRCTAVVFWKAHPRRRTHLCASFESIRLSMVLVEPRGVLSALNASKFTCELAVPTAGRASPVRGSRLAIACAGLPMNIVGVIVVDSTLTTTLVIVGLRVYRGVPLFISVKRLLRFPNVLWARVVRYDVKCVFSINVQRRTRAVDKLASFDGDSHISVKSSLTSPGLLSG